MYSFKEWFKEFDTHSSADRRKAYKTLIASGCDEEKLCRGLILSTYVRPKKAGADVRWQLDSMLRGIRAATKKLTQVANIAHDVRMSQFIWIRTAIVNTDADVCLGEATREILYCQQRLLRTWRECAEMAKVVQPDLKQFQKSKDPNTQYLCALALYVRKTTGCWHDRQLGHLLLTAYAASGQRISITAEGLAKRLQRLRKREPGRFCEETAPFHR